MESSRAWQKSHFAGSRPQDSASDDETEVPLGSTIGNFLTSIRKHADAFLGDIMCQPKLPNSQKADKDVVVDRHANKSASLLKKCPKQRSSFTRVPSGATSSSAHSLERTRSGSAKSNSLDCSPTVTPTSYKDVFNSLVLATRSEEIQEARIKRDLQVRQKIYDAQRRRNSHDEVHVKYLGPHGPVVREVKVFRAALQGNA